MSRLPTGTVTFLITDIEGSTRRWEGIRGRWGEVLAGKAVSLREAMGANGGVVFRTMGDAFCAVFVTAPEALAAALAAQRALFKHEWGAKSQVGPLRVRIALHTGVALERGGDYYGPSMDRATG